MKVSIKKIDEHTTTGKVYCSGRSKTLMAAIPKKFAYAMDLEPGDHIKVHYDKKAKSLTVTKYTNGKREKEKEKENGTTENSRKNER